MLETRKFESFRNVTALTITTLFLHGCFLQEDETDEVENSAASAIEEDFEISGSVGDGPVVGAAMRVMQNDGVELKSFKSDSSASYNIVVKTKGRYYPLTIDAVGGTDLVTNAPPDFTLIGAALEPSKKYVVNLNPFSTVIMEMARDLSGGPTKSNIYAAQDILASAMDFGLGSMPASGPMTGKIDSSNVAEIVKGSEAVGEVVRRTRDWLQFAGFAWNGDDVIGALSSDLIDGVIDGRGGPRVNARLAAIANLVITQVLLESAANELHVNGADATALLESAIETMNLGAASPSISEVTATTGMLFHVDVGLGAADTISDDSRVSSLKTSAAGLQPGLQPMLARSVLPSDYRQTMDDVILMMLTSGPESSTMIEEVNDTVRTASGIVNDPGSGDPPTVEIIVDNLDANTTQSGTWRESGAAGPYLGSSVYCEFGCLFTWHPGLSVSGNYEVYVYWTYHTARTTNATYQVDHNGGSNTVTVNQRDSSLSNQWYLIGTYDLTAGVNGNVSVSFDESESGVSVSADAVRYVRTDSGESDDSGNRVPTISGTPPSSISINNVYSFTPVALDADNDTLSFTFSGLPAWITTRNSSTGRISGTPGAEHIGNYNDITITVSDGQSIATLGPFSIAVNATGLGTITLNWQPPTQYEDGSPLNNALAGYRIYWGTTPGSYPNVVTLDNPGLTTFVVENLVPGDYEFVTTAFDVSGVESRFSNAASKTVQ